MSDTNAFACTVEGMCCAAESVPIERAVRALPGVRYVVADTGLARLSVTYDADALCPERIVAQVERLGFRIAPTTPSTTLRAGDHRPPTADQQRTENKEQRTQHFTQHILRFAFYVLRITQPRDLLTALCGLLILAAWLGELLG